MLVTPSFEQIIPKTESISQWYMNYNLEANVKNFHLFLSPCEDQTLTVENYFIKSSRVKELLEVTTVSNLNFKKHILSLCKKTNCKLHAVSFISKHIYDLE